MGFHTRVLATIGLAATTFLPTAVTPALAIVLSEGPEPCTWCAAVAARGYSNRSGLGALQKGPTTCRLENATANGCRTETSAVGEIDVPLPNGAWTRFKLQRELSFGTPVIRGSDDAGRRLLIVDGARSGVGSIESYEGRWEIRKDLRGDWNMRVHQADHIDLEDDFVAVSPSRMPAYGKSSLRESARAMEATGSVDSKIDLLLLYTPELVKYFGGTDQTVVEFVYVTALLNDTLAASGIPVTVDLVGIEESELSNAMLTADVLIELAYRSDRTKVARDVYGADFVVLMRHKTHTNGDQGRAMIGGAFGVSHLGCSDWVSTGNGGSYRPCGEPSTFVHEVGHMLGAGHSSNDTSSMGAALAPYGHGYIGCGPDGPGTVRKGTVMAFGYQGERVMLFSSPALTNMGYVCGDPETADNVRLIRELLPTSVSYRDRRPSSGVSVQVLVDRPVIELGEAVKVTHLALRADSCAATGDWFGAKAMSGSVSVTPPTPGTYTYGLTCTGIGGSASGSVALSVKHPVPEVDISFVSSAAVQGGNAIIRWSTKNADSCEASGAWSGPRTPNGSETITPVNYGAFTYVLSCVGPGGSNSASATLDVKKCRKFKKGKCKKW